MKTTNEFLTPIYSVNDVAKIVDVPRSTIASWTEMKLITRQKTKDHMQPTIPFVGLTEAYVLAAFRRQAKISMQEIRKAVKKLENEFGVDHPLASKKLSTDGARIFYDFANSKSAGLDNKETRKLTVVRNNQTVFAEIVDMYLQDIQYDRSGFAKVISLQEYKFKAVVDPYRSYGSPIIDRIGVRISDIVGQLKANESWENICEGYGTNIEELKEIARVNRRAA